MQIFPKEEISKVLSKFSSVRKEIRCTVSSAWFRGHGDTNWGLLPTLHRFGSRHETDSLDKIRSLESDIRKKRKDLKKFYKKKTQIKKEIGELYFRGNPSNTSSEQKVRIEALANDLEREIALKRRKIVQIEAKILAEQDVFDEFSHLSKGLELRSSWNVLVQMRHHGVPTRLLDWTERLEIAMFFATATHRKILNENGIRHLSEINEECVKLISESPRASIWAMNPYSTSKVVCGRHSIIDVLRNPNLDYYKCFFIDHSWPYDLPLPIFPPGLNDRVDAQGGFFTIHGNRKEGLEEFPEIGKKRLKKIEITHRESLAIIIYLENIIGLDRFTVFRDLDSLGGKLFNKFRNVQSWGR